MSRILMSLLSGLAFLPVHAEPRDSLRTLEEVVVTASSGLSVMRSGSPVQLLSHEDMRRMGVQDVAEAVSHFAGVQVKDYGGVGGLKTVGVRGMGAMHTGVSYDGVMVGNCQSGQVDISRFALDNVSLLWLSVGQQDDIFCSARQYASAATLNIETGAYAADSTLLLATARTGSFGLFQPSVLCAAPVSHSLTLSAYADWQRSDGNYPFTLYNGIDRIHAKRYNSDLNSWRGELNALWRISGRQTLRTKVYGFTSKRGLPGGIVYDNPFAAERLTDRDFFAQTLYENRFSRRLWLKTAAKWNYQWNRDYDIVATKPQTNKFRQNETYLSATLCAEPLSNLHVSLAQDFMHNYLSTTLPNCPYPSRNSWLTMLAARYDLRRFTATASLLNTVVDENVRTGDAGNNFHRISPAFSLMWQPFDTDLRLRLSYKDIFRTPTLNDLYYRYIGNTHLRPEKARQWNIGATWNRHLSRTVDYLALTLDAYCGNVKDKILAVPTMFIWKMQNIGRVRMTGVDLTAATMLIWRPQWTTQVQVSGSWIHATDRTDPTSYFYKDQLAYTPQYSASASVMTHTPYVDITYNLMFTGRRYSSTYNAEDTHMPAFADHSLSISRQWRHWRAQLDLRNLGGDNYEVVRFYPMPGFNWRATLTYQL